MTQTVEKARLVGILRLTKDSLLQGSAQEAVQAVHKENDEDLRLKCLALKLDYESTQERSAMFQEQTACTRLKAHKLALKAELGEVDARTARALESKNFHRMLVEMGVRIEERSKA